MFRANALLPVPEIAEGQSLQVEFIGPLARSQRMEEAVAVERLYQLGMQLAQADPNVMDLFDNDTAIRLRGELLGVPKTVLRGPAEVEQIRRARAEQQRMQQEMMAAQQQAEMNAAQAKTVTQLNQPENQGVMEEAMNQIQNLEMEAE